MIDLIKNVVVLGASGIVGGLVGGIIAQQKIPGVQRRWYA